jgi:glycosyltransferase involved in cell wall biosynthesis
VSPAGAPRILHAPADIGGHARGLSLAERELGLQSDVAVFSPQRWGYTADIDLNAGIDVPVPVRMARRAAFLREAIERYDIFHFNYGQTLLQVRQLGRVLDELPLLRKRGKKVLVTFQGCDLRPFSECFCRRPACVKTSPYRRLAGERALAHADRVLYLNPDLGRHLSGGEFFPYANVDPRAIAPAPFREQRGELVVVHAPTDRSIKGSRHVIEAVDLLRAEGTPVRLDLLEGLTHDEVRERTAAADAGVDQLLIGWYGGFAVEAMALAKPVVCFIRESENPFDASLPIVRASPSTLVGRLRELLAEPARRREAGEAGRRFVEREHDPRVLARRALDGLVELP